MTISAINNEGGVPVEINVSDEFDLTAFLSVVVRDCESGDEILDLVIESRSAAERFRAEVDEAVDKYLARLDRADA